MTSPQRQTPLRQLAAGSLSETCDVLLVQDAWRALARKVTHRDGTHKFTQDYHFVKLAASRNPPLTVIRSMYSDNRTVHYLLDLLEPLSYRAANPLRRLIGEPPLEAPEPPLPDRVFMPEIPFPRFQNTEEILHRAGVDGRPEDTVATVLPRFETGDIIAVPYRILREVTNDFNPSPHGDPGGFKIGQGGFADVFYGEDQAGRRVAIKRLHNDDVLAQKQFSREVTALTGLDHPNLLPVLGYSDDGSNKCIIYKYACRGSLRTTLLNKSNSLPVETRIRVAQETCHVIHYLHSRDFIHRDVTCANILLDENYKVLLGDFGQLKQSDPSRSVTMSQVVGTQVYMAPELVLGVSKPAQDVYAYGMVLLVILTGLSAFDDTRDDEEKSLKIYVRENCDDILEIADTSGGAWPAGCARSMHACALKCLEYERENRPTSEQLVEIVDSWSSEEATSSEMKPLEMTSSEMKPSEMTSTFC